MLRPKGSAIEALPHMHSLLNARPEGFDSLEEAIEWQYVPLFIPLSHTVTLFFCQRTDECNTQLQLRARICPVNTQTLRFHITSGPCLHLAHPAALDSTILDQYATCIIFLFVFVHLRVKTEWFTSLSANFLTVRTARMLILAGTDRLDKELMIGQMQGKFQMEVVPGVGHMLHEVRSSVPTQLVLLLCP